MTRFFIVQVHTSLFGWVPVSNRWHASLSSAVKQMHYGVNPDGRQYRIKMFTSEIRQWL